jgi:nitrogen fixation/metabolism regulation signal transduction histidine kinase
MKYLLYFSLQIIAIIALIASIAVSAQWYWIGLAALATLVTFILAYKSVAVPLRTIQNGLYLLQEQDYSSRLRAVGQYDADKIVKLFNELMDSMKNERAKNIEQNAFLQKLVEASPMGIAICDFDGNIVQTNKAYDTMITPEINTLLNSLTDGEAQVIRSGQSQIYRCSRSFFMESGFKRPFYQIEQLTDEILKAETAVFNKIVRTVGHEVNNTLGSVTSVLQSLEDIHQDDELLTQTIESSIDSCDKLCAFVKGYSDVVKLPAPTFVHTDVNKFIAEVLPSLRHLAPDNISITTELTDKDLSIELDTMLFDRVLVNIIKNAVESIGNAAGNIIIKTDKNSLSIIDNGHGISADNALKLFTPFFSTKHQDRGLGLMLIADILRKHNFDFSLTTDAETHLTSFCILFRQNRKI